MQFIWLIIGYVAGAIVTVVGLAIVSKFGVYLIDRRNPDKEVHKLDFGDPRDLAKKKYIVLKVDYHADLSQK